MKNPLNSLFQLFRPNFLPLNKKESRILIPILLNFIIFTFILSSCSSKKEEPKELRELKDDLGRIVKVKPNPTKVMALSSSLTEMLYLICPDSEIIARTQNCDYPEVVLSKPVVNNYPIDYEKLLVMKPDIVLAKDGIVGLEEASKIESMGIPVYFQHYGNLEDIFSGIEELGEVLNKSDRAKKVADSLRYESKKLRSELPSHSISPTVLLIISLDKIFVFGKDSYATDIIEYAGGKNAMDQIFNNPFPQITSEYILKINPDIIFILGEKPMDIKIMYPEFTKLDAVKKNKIFRIEGDLISRPGPRVVEAIKIIHKEIQLYER